jgi:hypothetical protein
MLVLRLIDLDQKVVAITVAKSKSDKGWKEGAVGRIPTSIFGTSRKF